MRKSFAFKHKNKFVLYRIRKNLLAIIAGLLAVFAIFSMFVFYQSERKAYRHSLEELNVAMANQVVSVYELYLQNVKEVANETVYSNQELLKLSAQERDNVWVKRELLDMVDSVNIMNTYIHSACLYFEEDGMVYSSISMPYSIMHLSNYVDKAVFEEETVNKPYLVGPHLVYSTQSTTYPREHPLVISYVVPVIGSKDIVRLCINMNARSLYSMILPDYELEQNKNFYLVNQEGFVVFHRNRDYLFIQEEDLPYEENVIRSRVYSQNLNLTVVFENIIPPLESKLPQFALWILLGLGMAVAAMSVTVLYSTLPIRKMVQIAKMSNLRDFLAKSGSSVDTMFWDQSMDNCVNHVVGLFRMGSAADTEEFLMQSIKNAAKNEKEYYFLEIKMSVNTVAIIFGNIRNYSEEQFRRYVQLQCEEILASFKAKDGLYGVISQVRTGVEQMRDSYQECLDTFQYQYLFPYPIIGCEEIDRSRPVYPFPVRHERHIINNMMACKTEACIRHIDAIFEEFKSGEYLIKDREIKRYLEVMEENIALRLANLSLPVEGIARTNFEACSTLDELYQIFVEYVHEILAQITSQPHEEENNVSSTVLEYIDKHFCENDICLSKIAEEFSVSTGQVSRIVKEASHRTFSEYITLKRIGRSKELLAEGTMSINEVSEMVGFTYPYYFIRKFKELEGVTPGQYIGVQNNLD